MRKILSILLSLCLFSCSNINKEQSSSIIINPTENNTARLQDVFSIVDIVCLQKGSNHQIGEVTKVNIYNDYIYVLDFRIAKSLFVFNRKGEFINRIQGVQQIEPFSPFQIADFDINRKSGEIILIDDIQKRVFIYNENGINQINIFQLSTRPSKIIWSNNNNFIVKAKKEINKTIPLFFGINLDDDDINEFPILYPQHEIDAIPYAEKFSFSRYNDQVLIYNYKNDTIYGYCDSLSPRYIINYDKYGPPPEFWSQLDKGKSYIHKLGSSRYAYRKDFIYENDSMVLFPFVFREKVFHCFHNKKYNSNHVLKITDLDNEYRNIRPAGLYQKGMILSYDAIKLTNMFLHGVKDIEQLGSGGHNSSLKSVLDILKNDDNPVLFFLEPKIPYNKQ